MIAASEGVVDVGASLVADGEAAEAGEPGKRALDHPPLGATPKIAALADCWNDVGS